MIKNLFKWLLISLLIVAVFVGILFLQAFVFYDNGKKSSSTSDSLSYTEGSSSSGTASKNSSNRNNEEQKNGGSNKNGESNENGKSGTNNGIDSNTDNNDSNEEGVNSNTGSSNSDTNSGNTNNSDGNAYENANINSNDNEGTISKAKNAVKKVFTRDFWRNVASIAKTSFKEGYDKAPEYLDYNFDDVLLFYEGDQSFSKVDYILDRLIKNSDDNFYSKPKVTLVNCGGLDGTVEYTDSESYKSALNNIKNSLDKGATYNISFGYTRFYLVANEVIITKL